MLHALLVAALADDVAPNAPEVGGHLVGVAARDDVGAAPGAGGGAVVGLRAVGPLWAEAVVDVGWTPGGVRTTFVPQLRLFATPRDGRMAVSLAVGAGAALSPGVVRAQVHASVATDLRLSKSVSLRLEGGWAPVGRSLAVVRFTGGLVWSPRVRPKVDVWLPYPDCRWVDELDPAAQAAYLRELGAAGRGADGASVDAAPPAEVPRVTGRWLVVRPGAAVRDASGQVVARAGDDGSVFVPDGVGDVVLEDGAWVTPPPQVEGYLTWRYAPPAQVVVRFALNSAELDEAARVSVRGVASEPGPWRWRVVGSYSEEGDAVANRALAVARATAVRDALLADGLAPDQVVAIDVRPPLPGVVLEAQRVAWIEPVTDDEVGP